MAYLERPQFHTLVAEMVRRIEMVEAWGRGMPLIFKHEPDVEFKEIAGIFIAAFDRPSYKSGFEKEHSMENEGLIRGVGRTTQETTQEKILSILQARPETTRNELAVEIGITPDGIKYNLSKLRAAGVIRHVGPTKAGHWEVLK